MNAITRARFLFPALKIINTVQGSRDFHRWVAPTMKALANRKAKMGPTTPNPRNTYAEWNYDVELYAFSHRLGEEIDKDSLKQALLDRSYVVQQEKEQKEVGIEPGLDMKDNEEMSVEGGRLIDLYLDQYLTSTLPKLPRKYIKNIKEYLSSDELLAGIATKLGMSDLILNEVYPVGEEGLVRSLKSLFHAVALSGGVDRACALIRDLVVAQIACMDLTKFCFPENPMKELEEHLKAAGNALPEPRLISAIGRHTILASYDVGIYVDRTMIGRGFGESAETAQNMAACDALWRAWDMTLRRKPFPFKLELPPLEKFAASAASSAS